MAEPVREQLIAELRDIQAKTISICIDALESLHSDKQGLPLDDYTISACSRMLRNLRDARPTPPAGETQ